MSKLLIITGITFIIIAIILKPIERKWKINKQAKYDLQVKKRRKQLEEEKK